MRRIEPVRIPAATCRRSTAPVEKDDRDAFIPRKLGQPTFCLVNGPIRLQVATVFGAIRKTEHHRLAIAPAAQMRPVCRMRVHIAHLVFRAGQVSNGLEERHDIQGRFLIQSGHAGQCSNGSYIDYAAAVADDVAVAGPNAVVLLDFGHRTQRCDDVVVPFFFKPVHGAFPLITEQFIHLLRVRQRSEGFDIDTCHSERFIQRLLNHPAVLTDVQAGKMQAEQAQFELEPTDFLDEESVRMLRDPVGDVVELVVQIRHRQHRRIRVEHGVFDSVLKLVEAGGNVLKRDAAAQIPDLAAVTPQQRQAQALRDIPSRLRIHKWIAIAVPAGPESD